MFQQPFQSIHLSNCWMISYTIRTMFYSVLKAILISEVAYLEKTMDLRERDTVLHYLCCQWCVRILDKLLPRRGIRIFWMNVTLPCYSRMADVNCSSETVVICIWGLEFINWTVFVLTLHKTYHTIASIWISVKKNLYFKLRKYVGYSR